jgi:hypothetical protein
VFLRAFHWPVPHSIHEGLFPYYPKLATSEHPHCNKSQAHFQSDSLDNDCLPGKITNLVLDATFKYLFVDRVKVMYL